MLPSTQKVPNPLARMLYRHCLRASQNGRFPEAFGTMGAEVYNAQTSQNMDHPSLAMPSVPSHVQQRLKHFFRNTDYTTKDNGNPLSISPLQVLPQLIENDIGLSTTKGQNNNIKSKMCPFGPLAILERFDIAALPGERIEVEIQEGETIDEFLSAVSLKSRYVILRQSTACSKGILLKVLNTNDSIQGRSFVSAIAGQRIKLVGASTDEKSIGSWTTTTDYQILNDTNPDDNSSTNRHARQYILDMLHCILPNQNSNLLETLLQFGLPPLDLEAFSFWALRYILVADDARSRWKWINSISTSDRLNAIMDEIEYVMEDTVIDNHNQHIHIDEGNNDDDFYTKVASGS